MWAVYLIIFLFKYKEYIHKHTQLMSRKLPIVWYLMHDIDSTHANCVAICNESHHEIYPSFESIAKWQLSLASNMFMKMIEWYGCHQQETRD